MSRKRHQQGNLKDRSWTLASPIVGGGVYRPPSPSPKALRRIPDPGVGFPF